jgi:alpha-methylacyl-CoA racemase
VNTVANKGLSHPLRGVRVVEFEGIGPGPLAALMLADMGAEVTVIVRPGGSAVGDRLGGGGAHPLRRGKQVTTLDLKQPADRERAMALIASADALIEGNRPGVMERLGLGPADCAAHNPHLVYGRMTGWGQSGPLAQAAGHDLNYVALTGLLSLAAPAGQVPVVPPTVVGDAAGALGLAFGIACALVSARSGKRPAPEEGEPRGRVVDAAIVDVVAMLGTLVHWIRAGGQLAAGQPSPFHDSPFYDTYACGDGGFITIGALEPQFYVLLLNKLGLDDVDAAAQYDTTTWPALKARLTQLFLTRPRSAWCELLEGTDVCFAPVLSLDEAAAHPHHTARGTFAPGQPGHSTVVAAAPRFLPLR